MGQRFVQLPVRCQLLTPEQVSCPLALAQFGVTGVQVLDFCHLKFGEQGSGAFGDGGSRGGQERQPRGSPGGPDDEQDQ